MKSLFSILVIGALIAVLTSLAFGEVPRMINYQGKLTKASGAPLDTTIQMVFNIYADSNGTISKWNETQNTVKVEKGIFNVLLGNVTAIPDSVFNGSIRYLGVKVGGEEITPRRPIVSVGYAFHSAYADTAKLCIVVADSDWSFADTNIYRLNGNVGIGTTQPTQKLDVEGGDVLFKDLSNLLLKLESRDHEDTWLMYRTQGTDRWSIGVREFDDNLRFTPGYYTNNPSMIINTNGNVGIGTTSPAYKLDVSGDIRATGTIYGTVDNADKVDLIHASTTPTANYLYPLDANTKIPNTRLYTGSGNGLDADKVDAYHAGNSSGQVAVSNNTLCSTLNADMVDGYHYSSTWPTNLGNIQSACLNDFHNIGGTDDDVPDNDGEVPDNISINNGRLYAPSGSGNVGIGTTSPGYKLEVVGNARVSTDLKVDGTIKLHYDTTITIHIIPGNDVTVTHNLGGDPEKYIVYMVGISSSGHYIHQKNYGTSYRPLGYLGCEWGRLTSTTITVSRGSLDDTTAPYDDWDSTRICILKNQ